MTEKSLLDAKGLKCPLPVLKARKALKSLAAGDLLEVHSTDPSSQQDFPNFCETTGHELLDQQQQADVFVFTIKKAD
ncbi:sulfurtransferase TusA family protein [Rhodovibrionaceae bacterium A322]